MSIIYNVATVLEHKSIGIAQRQRSPIYPDTILDGPWMETVEFSATSWMTTVLLVVRLAGVIAQ
ncbi:hypothetical protein XaplCFBP3123_18150 [Xanthomonas arboricola pv. populi]|nr:hypothetical protein XaplCFBP3123_18150 [Xanthomonas arboricola pv. populi]